MKIHKFLYNIHYITNEDLKSFEKFLLSPYFNTLQSIYLVYSIIRKNMTYITQQKYEELKSIIMSETKYSKTTLRKILSYLNDKYIVFVKVQAYTHNKYYSDYLSCNYLLLKGNYNLLSKSVKELNEHLSESKVNDEDLFIKLFETNILNYNVLSTSEDTMNPLSKLDKQKYFTLESSKNLMVYTISKTTINFVNYVIQCNDSNNKNDTKYPLHLDSLFDLMKTPEFELYNDLQKTTIILFHKIFMLYNNILRDKYYDDYKDYFNKSKNNFNVEFCKTQTSILLGFSILRQRVNDKTLFYASEALSILFEYIDNEYYKNENTEYLHPLMYRNYVMNCMNIDKKELLLKFVDSHTDKLHPNEIELMKKFGMSHYYYLEKEYGASMETIESINNAKFLYKYDLYNLIIKNCFEIEKYDKIENILHNYKEYIYRDDFLTKYDKERYSYFVYCMKKFLIAKYKYESRHNLFDFEYLSKIINAKQSFAMKNWLNKKVVDFIAKHHKKYGTRIKDN